MRQHTRSNTDRLVRQRTLRQACAMSHVVLGAAMLTGCAAVTSERLEVEAPANITVIAVDVANQKGAVEVRVDPRIDGPRVNAKIRWANGVKEKQARTLAQSVHIETTIDTAGPRAVLRVRSTDDVDAELPDHWVNLKITLPRVDGVRVFTTGGDIVLVGVTGAIQVENGDGAIELRTNTPVKAPVALITKKGSVYFQAPVGSHGSLDMQTNHGQATFVSKSVVLADMLATPTTISGVLARGDNPITLRSGAGDVRAWIIDDPIALVRMFR